MSPAVALHPAYTVLVAAVRARRAERRVERPDPSAWLVLAARLGYAARGVLWVGIGALAFAVAVGFAQQAAGSRRVIALVAALPFGRLLAAAFAIGLLGYATLSMVAAVRAPEELPDAGLAGVAARVVDAFTGCVYLALAMAAARLATVPAARGDRWGEGWLAWALGLPHAPLLIGAAGVVVLASGLAMLWRAATRDFATRLDRRLLDADTIRWLSRLHRAGTAARGVVFALCGVLLLRGAPAADPGDVRGLAGTLETLGDQRAGPALLALVALALVGYGVYQLAKARFRRMEL